MEERLEEDEVSCSEEDGRAFCSQEHFSNDVESPRSLFGLCFFRGVLRLTVYWKLSVHLEKSTAV